jgi:hypothetical protein
VKSENWHGGNRRQRTGLKRRYRKISWQRSARARISIALSRRKRKKESNTQWRKLGEAGGEKRNIWLPAWRTASAA